MKEEEKKKGGKTNVMNGRALFKYDPTLFQDDNDAADEDTYADRVEIDNNEEEKKEEETLADYIKSQ
jgi:hypothetical protein